MEKYPTNITDINKKILEDLDDKSLLEFCKTSKYGSEICKDELFWKNRFNVKFGRSYKNDDRTWKDFYLKIVFYLDKYKDKNKILYQISLKGIKNLDLINFFLVRGANVNDGLIGAAKGGDINLIEYYVERGARDYISAYLNTSDKEIQNYLRNLGLEVFQIL